MATDVQTRSLSGLTGGRRGAFLAYRWLLLAFLLAGAAQIMKLTAAPAGAARVSAGLWAGIVLAAFAGAALTLLARGNLKASDLTANLGTTVAVVAYATLGALIVRRAGNLIGWLMLGEGAGLGPADRGPAVHRTRYDAESTVAAFAARLKDTVDLDSVRDDLVGVVHRGLEPAHLSVWIRPHE